MASLTLNPNIQRIDFVFGMSMKNFRSGDDERDRIERRILELCKGL